MRDRPLTLMAVHAHPDDETTLTGGILARYSAEGVRTVLVTCTNGEMGDAPDGSKPDDPGHDEQAVVASRLGELEQSRRILGIPHLELLGYRDSGMQGWESNNAPGAFASVPVDEAARRLAELIRRYEPDVVVTYDDFGFYGHPDHIQAHRITVAALEMTGSHAVLYFPTVRRSLLPQFRERLLELGLDAPDEVDAETFGSPDEMIGATIDCRAYAERKMMAVRAHGSQQENLLFLRLPLDVFTELFGVEEFVLARGAPPATPVDDLFAGIRERV